ncbi:MAG: hypothetical protein HGA44_06060, partial [Cellulomonadaceae bacterium]|nr:hypothetical protein [Cellulomonadaceae bacterium]
LSRAVADTDARRVLVLAAADVADVRAPAGVEADVMAVTEVQLVIGAATFASSATGSDAVGVEREVRRAVLAARWARVVPDVGGRVQADRMLDAARGLLSQPSVLLTVLTGDATPAGHEAALLSGIAASHPGVDVVVLTGALAGHGVQMGAE